MHLTIPFTLGTHTHTLPTSSIYIHIKYYCHVTRVRVYCSCVILQIACSQIIFTLETSHRGIPPPPPSIASGHCATACWMTAFRRDVTLHYQFCTPWKVWHIFVCTISWVGGGWWTSEWERGWQTRSLNIPIAGVEHNRDNKNAAWIYPDQTHNSDGFILYSRGIAC